jgi:hypothetical protein
LAMVGPLLPTQTLPSASRATPNGVNVAATVTLAVTSPT